MELSTMLYNHIPNSLLLSYLTVYDYDPMYMIRSRETLYFELC